MKLFKKVLVIFSCFFMESILLYSFSNSTANGQELPDNPFLATGKDHGEITSRHIQDTKKFFNERLKKNGQYDKQKIIDFIHYLYEEKSTVVNNVYQTILFEKLQIDLYKYGKSKKKAEENSGSKGRIVSGYDEYLIPKMKELLSAVQNNEPVDKLDGIVDDFLRAYMSYFLPNGMRTYWPFDINLFHIIKKVFRSYKYKKDDPQKTYPINLINHKKYQKIIHKCLQTQVPLNHYFNSAELKKLVKCDFDISKLDPGVSPFWAKVTDEYVDNRNKQYDQYFPKKGEKIVYKRINIRSRTSPKIKAVFMRDGEEYRIKVKMGQEVNVDVAMGKILQYVGLNQDQSRYHESVRVYLGKETFEEFISAYSNKYRIESVAQFIQANGKDEVTGEEWVDINDVMIEARPKDELRVAPFDIGGWDLQNRREYRSLILVLGWLGIIDIHPGNLKLIFQKKDDKLYPMLRLFDPGASMGGPLYIDHKEQLFALGTTYRVNDFPETFIKKGRSRNEIKLRWNDWNNRYRNFQHTSWYDLKWMARNILRIPKEKLYHVLIESGMPMPVAKIFHYKLLLRRNELIDVFKLDQEFERDDVPKIENINLKDKHGYLIKKGKVKKAAFPGKNTTPIVAENIWTVFPKLLNFDIPVQKWNHDSSGTELRTGLRGMEGLKREINFLDYGKKDITTSFPIGVGVQAIVTRRVDTNTHLMNTNGKINLYKIVDSVRLRIGVDSPLLREALDKAPIIEGAANVKFYEKMFQHIHYHDNAKEAYTTKFNVIKILKNINYYAAYHLNPMEVLQNFEKIGFEMELGVGIHTAKPIVDNEISVLGGVRNIRSKYIVRDQYGHLHFYHDKNKTLFGASVLNVGNLNLVAIPLPLLSLRMAHTKFKYSLKDFIMRMPQNHRDQSRKHWNNERKLEEFKSLEKISNWNEKIELPKNVEVNYAVDAKGKKIFKGLGLLFVANKEKSKSWSKSKVQLPDGETKNFYKYNLTTNRFIGVDRMNFDFSLYDLFLKNRKKTSLNVEMDDDKHEKFVVAIKTQDYFRSRSLTEVKHLLKDLNRRYSKKTSEAFYRDYILPPEDLVKKYPKVYAVSYIFLYGESLKKKFKKISKEKVEELAYQHFTNAWYFGQKRLKKLSYREKIELKWMVSSVSQRIHKIKKLIDSKPSRKNSYKLSKAYVKLLRTLKTDVYGLYFLRKVVGSKGMFVMGEISGLLRTYSPLNDLMQLQRRRFMGRSWGEYKTRPPLQNFLRKNRLIPPSAHIDKTASDAQIFGTLETGVPGNLEPIFSHDLQF